MSAVLRTKISISIPSTYHSLLKPKAYDIRDMIEDGQTVDVLKVEDKAIQQMMYKYLRCSGANI